MALMHRRRARLAMALPRHRDCAPRRIINCTTSSKTMRWRLGPSTLSIERSHARRNGYKISSSFA